MPADSGADVHDPSPHASLDPDSPGGVSLEATRLDREHQELFHELRAVIPGAQVLFAFLLTVAFTPVFSELGTDERAVYFATFILAGIALCLLLSPAAYHRIQFRRGDKDVMLRLANLEALVAMVLLSISLSGVVYLIGSVVYTTELAIASAASLWLLTLIVWWIIPLTRRRRNAS
jgi:uncharacterized membrane protein